MDDRKAIERNIRELSLEIYDDLLQQQINKSNNGQLNIPKFEAMMFEWSKLSDYYRDCAYRPDKVEDTEMSLFIVNNYLHWTNSLQVHLTHASKAGSKELAEAINELLDELEYNMKAILATLADFDEFRIE